MYGRGIRDDVTLYMVMVDRAVKQKCSVGAVDHSKRDT
jgi:hypothetical protein